MRKVPEKSAFGGPPIQTTFPVAPGKAPPNLGRLGAETLVAEVVVVVGVRAGAGALVPALGVVGGGGGGTFALIFLVKSLYM